MHQYTDSASTVWYYISYDNGDGTQYGYVTSGDVGYIYSSGTNSTQKIVSTKKIDAGMVSDVYMYLTQDMADNCQLVDIDGNSLILATNTRVSVITVSEYSSYVQVSIDGNTYYGWVNNDNLIDTGALPTATIVGLCLLAVAVILTVLTIVIIRTRKHKLVRHE